VLNIRHLGKNVNSFYFFLIFAVSDDSSAQVDELIRVKPAFAVVDEPRDDFEFQRVRFRISMIDRGHEKEFVLVLVAAGFCLIGIPGADELPFEQVPGERIVFACVKDRRVYFFLVHALGGHQCIGLFPLEVPLAQRVRPLVEPAIVERFRDSSDQKTRKMILAVERGRRILFVNHRVAISVLTFHPHLAGSYWHLDRDRTSSVYRSRELMIVPQGFYWFNP